jgi:hypothetical protein
MVEQFYNPSSIIIGIIKLLVLVVIGYLANKKGIISKEAIHSLNKIVLWLCLPALIVSRTIASFDPDTMSYWWVLPIVSLLMSGMGGFFGYLVQGFQRRPSAQRIHKLMRLSELRLSADGARCIHLFRAILRPYAYIYFPFYHRL